MNGNKPGENLTKGFLQRIWSHITTKIYQNKLKRIKYFDKTWDNIKWKLRFLRLTYFVIIYFGAKYIFVDRVYLRVKDQRENKRKLYLDKISNLNLSTSDDFIESSDDNINNGENKNIENLLVEKINQLNNEVVFIEKIAPQELLSIKENPIKSNQNFNNKNATKLNPQKPLNSKKKLSFENLNTFEKCSILEEIHGKISQGFSGESDLSQILILNNKEENNSSNMCDEKDKNNKGVFNNPINNGNNLFSNKIFFYKVNNVLSKKQLKDESDESQKFINLRYLELVQGLSLNLKNKLALSINLFEVFDKKEEIAFFIASKLTALKFKRETEKEIDHLIKSFVSDLILEDKFALHFEDFQYLIKDMEITKNYNEYIVLNPYFAKNHTVKYYDFINKMREFIFTEKCRYISHALNMLKNSEFAIHELRNYDMEKFKIINLAIPNATYKSELEQYLNAEIDHILDNSGNLTSNQTKSLI